MCEMLMTTHREGPFLPPVRLFPSQLGLLTAVTSLVPHLAALARVGADHAGVSEACILDLLGPDEEFSVLAVASRLGCSDSNSVEDALGFAEDDVHFFKGTVGSLRIEEIDDRDNEGIAGKAPM